MQQAPLSLEYFTIDFFFVEKVWLYKITVLGEAKMQKNTKGGIFFRSPIAFVFYFIFF